MADENVNVRIGAQTGEATDAMVEATRSIADSLQKITGSLDSFGSKNKQVVNDALKNNADLSRSFLELKASVTGGFNGIVGVVERFRGVLATLTAALAGGYLWKSSVSEMLRMEDAVRGLTITFGMNTEKATQTAVALKLAGLSAETFEQMAQRVGRVLRTQSDEFDRLGVKTKDAQGNLLPMEQILQNIYLRMQDFKAGTDQTEFALSTVGRNAKDFASDMERLNAVTERARQLQQELGIEMGPERIAAIERYRVETNAFGVILGNVADKIGEAVLPQLMNLAGYFNSAGPAAAKLFVDVIRGMLTAIDYLITGLMEWKATAVGAWSAVTAALKGNLQEAQRAWAERNIAILQMEADLQKRIANLWQERAPGSDVGAGPLRSGGARFTPRPTGGGESRLSQWDAQLKAEQDAYNQMKLDQGSFETWSLAQTVAYWSKIRELTDLSVKERAEVDSKYYDARRQIMQKDFAAYIEGLEAQKAALGHNVEAKIEIAQTELNAVRQRYGAESAEAQAAYKKLVELRQQLADQRERIAEIEDKQAETTRKHAIDMARLNADQAVALQQISAQQRLAIERDYVDQEYQAEIDGLQKRIALMANDPTSDPVKLAELKAQLLKVEQDYQKQLTQIDNAAVLEREKYALQANDAIKSSMSDLLSNLINNTKSWKQTLLDAFKALDEQLVKIASNKIIDQLFGAGTQGGNFLSSITNAIFGGGAASGPEVAAQTANTTALTALTTAVAANTAALAASSAANFGAGGLGDLFGAGGGGGSSFFDLPFFAEGTPYVERTGLAVLHQGEAVVPSSANRAGFSGGISMRNTFVISGPMDTRTQSQIAMQMQRATQRAMQRSR